MTDAEHTARPPGETAHTASPTVLEAPAYSTGAEEHDVDSCDEQQATNEGTSETAGPSQAHRRKRGVAWTETEHRDFLLGLQKLGKGDWRGISRHYVVTRTPTQVASHAQKHFIRQQTLGKRKRRPSLFDITSDGPVDDPASSAPCEPVEGAVSMLKQQQEQQQLQAQQPLLPPPPPHQQHLVQQHPMQQMPPAFNGPMPGMPGYGYGGPMQQAAAMQAAAQAAGWNAGGPSGFMGQQQQYSHYFQLAQQQVAAAGMFFAQQQQQQQAAMAAAFMQQAGFGAGPPHQGYGGPQGFGVPPGFGQQGLGFGAPPGMVPGGFGGPNMLPMYQQAMFSQASVNGMPPSGMPGGGMPSGGPSHTVDSRPSATTAEPVLHQQQEQPAATSAAAAVRQEGGASIMGSNQGSNSLQRVISGGHANLGSGPGSVHGSVHGSTPSSMLKTNGSVHGSLHASMQGSNGGAKGGSVKGSIPSPGSWSDAPQPALSPPHEALQAAPKSPRSPMADAARHSSGELDGHGKLYRPTASHARRLQALPQLPLFGDADVTSSAGTLLKHAPHNAPHADYGKQSQQEIGSSDGGSGGEGGSGGSGGGGSGNSTQDGTKGSKASRVSTNSSAAKDSGGSSAERWRPAAVGRSASAGAPASDGSGSSGPAKDPAAADVPAGPMRLRPQQASEERRTAFEATPEAAAAAAQQRCA